MGNQILFYIVILLTNIIHGITGFAGTILAMPPSLMLVGYDIAKPILNVLAIFSGVYVFVGNYKNINWKELGKIVVVMALGIFGARSICSTSCWACWSSGFRYRAFTSSCTSRMPPQKSPPQSPMLHTKQAPTHCWCWPASSTGCSSAAARCSQAT